MKKLFVGLFFVLAMVIVFLSGYRSADRAPERVTTNVTVVVATNKLIVVAPRSKPPRVEPAVPGVPEEELEKQEVVEDEPPVKRVQPEPTKREVLPMPPPMTNMGPLVIDYPKPMFVGTPVPIRLRNLRPPSAGGGTVTVRAGTKLISRGMPVTASDDAILGELAWVTDGDKSAEEGSYIELPVGLQWVQVDLREVRKIEAVAVWHYHLQARAYKDVIILISNDPEFKTGVLPVTRDIYTAAYFQADPRQKFGAMLFNNDDDNSSGWTPGTDQTYVDDHRGLVVSGWGILARYVRLYSNGNTANGMNHYIEVEVFGM